MEEPRRTAGLHIVSLRGGADSCYGHEPGQLSRHSRKKCGCLPGMKSGIYPLCRNPSGTMRFF